MVELRPVPQIELERVADAGVQLVSIARQLHALSSRVKDEETRAALEEQINRLIDVGGTINKALQASTSVRA